MRNPFVHKYEVANRIDISRSAVLHNFDLMSSVTGKDIIPVLKSNAYGHGLKEVATILKDRSFPYIAVDGYFEALAIRKISKQPVLIMGSLGANDINVLAKKLFAFVLYSLESLQQVERARKPVIIHLEINTGMNRHGIELEELPEVIARIKAQPNITLEGVMTHFATADEVDISFMKQQQSKFEKAVQLVRTAGYNPKHIHTSNSAASSKPQSQSITAIRPGIALYGLNTLDVTDEYYTAFKNLHPVMQLTSRVDQIRTISKNETVGYNRTYKASGVQKVATIPIGYYEGIPRSLGNQSFITYKKRLLQTTGKICMNHTMFDCTNTNLKVGDEVILISADPNDPNCILNLRRSFGLFEYSLPTNFSNAIRRRVVA